MSSMKKIIAVALTDAKIYRQKRATYSCSNTGLTDALRDVFLNYHNDARRRVAKGTEPNNVGTLNPAKNMYKLEWDCTLEQQVQDAIASCPSGLGSWSNMAQNLIRWSSSAGFSNPAAQINTTLANWWGKAKQYGVTDPDNKYTSSNLYTFANMVFSETTKIGCAYKVCGNYMTVSCLYNAIGYYTNEPMWQTGTACASGSECTTYANSGCDAGLCTKGPDVPETNNECPANSGMTDSVRDTFLTLHNNYRSSVARGLEPDALGGYAPKASKMLKMVYDCNVEASAMRHALKCVYQHS
ncbi:SCP-like protein, partial [Oesophagostomum dentatum]